MPTENRRKERLLEANAKETRQNLELLSNSAMVDKVMKEQSLLPNNQRYIHIPKIENVVNDYNIQEAIKKVIRNKGAPGIDGITTEEIQEVMQKRWLQIKQEILEGKYKPEPVRRVEIPKPEGGVRQLGIPTVLDRVIQQAIYQELVYTFEATFSEHSYGFRLGRTAQQAVLKVQTYIQEGYEWLVDIDLEKFFDKVNHDILMSRIARKVKDKKILLLIRRYLQAGVMLNGLIEASEEGTPQGGPLSPLLSNVMLDDFDKELEKRGLRFARYADDCNIYVKSEKAGKRVLESATRFLTTKLKLKVNQSKSGVAHPSERKFLGFTFTKSGKIAVHESRTKRLKDKIRGLTKKMRGTNVKDSIRKLIMPLTRGWVNYFGIAEERKIFGNIDAWIRRKIRGILWRQWKTPRTRYRELINRGVKEQEAKAASYKKGQWKMSRTLVMSKAIGNNVIKSMGYIPMMDLICVRS